MIHLTDGRPDLFQWDTGRKVTFDGECRQMHFSNKVYGRTVDVDCTQQDGHSTAAIPDRLLQTAGELAVYAYVGAEPESYTKVEKVFHIRRRPRPADYVFTPADQTTLEEIREIAESVRRDADEGKFTGQNPLYIGSGPMPADKTAQIDPTAKRFSIPEVLQETGDSTEDAMSQAATTREIERLNESLGYVTPEMFGGVGDGKTDDSEAIQKAVDSGMEVKGYGDYKCSTPIIVSSDKTRLSLLGKTIFDGDGVVLKSSSNQVYLSEVRSVGKCVFLDATAIPVVYNEIRFDRMIVSGASAAIALKAVGTNYANENRFYGGRIIKAEIGVDADGSSTGVAYSIVEGNYFFGINFEEDTKTFFRLNETGQTVIDMCRHSPAEIAHFVETIGKTTGLVINGRYPLAPTQYKFSRLTEGFIYGCTPTGSYRDYPAAGMSNAIIRSGLILGTKNELYENLSKLTDSTGTVDLRPDRDYFNSPSSFYIGDNTTTIILNDYYGGPNRINSLLIGTAALKTLTLKNSSGAVVAIFKNIPDYAWLNVVWISSDTWYYNEVKMAHTT